VVGVDGVATCVESDEVCVCAQTWGAIMLSSKIKPNDSSEVIAAARGRRYIAVRRFVRKRFIIKFI
jgi:hypothetical protein